MSDSPQLSSREWEVVHLLLEGKSNKMIAAALQLSERTVEFHLKNIFAKCQVSSRLELALELKKHPEWLKAEKPGFSTVADQSEIAENNDRLNPKSWVTSLRKVISAFGREVKMDFVSSTNDRGGERTMTFVESIRVCLAKYAEFNGRATRPEFWWFTLAVVLATSAFSLIHEIAGSFFLLLVLLPQLAVGARRLRDSGQSPWWLLFLLAPVGGLVVVGYLCALPPAETLAEETPRTG